MKLLLDDQNPRLPDEAEGAVQEKLLQMLMEIHNLDELAEEILLLHEYEIPGDFVAFPQKDNFVVLEGNSRLAAHLCLLNPSLATPKLKKTFEKLAKELSLSPNTEVEVTVVDTREDGAPYLKAKHTSSAMQPWNRAMQNNFVKRQAQHLPRLSKEDKKKIVRANIYDAAKRLKYPKMIAKKIQNASEFPVSTLDRIVESKPGKEFLDFEIGENGEITPRNKKEGSRYAERRFSEE